MDMNRNHGESDHADPHHDHADFEHSYKPRTFTVALPVCSPGVEILGDEVRQRDQNNARDRDGGIERPEGQHASLEGTQYGEESMPPVGGLRQTHRRQYYSTHQ